MASIEYHARQCVAKYSATAVTINGTQSLETSFSSGTAFTGYIKDVTITPPEGSVDLISFLGEDSNTFQNARFEEKAFGPASISGTMMLSNTETIERLFYGDGTATVTATYHRYQPGKSSSGLTRLKIGGILVTLDNGTKKINVLMNNIMLTKLGDIKITGADGHWERSFEGMSLPADYYEEFQD